MHTNFITKTTKEASKEEPRTAGESTSVTLSAEVRAVLHDATALALEQIEATKSKGATKQPGTEAGAEGE